MVGINLKIRKEEKDLTRNSINTIEGEGGNSWYLVPLWLKKVGDNLFAEYSFEDLPERIKQQIEKPENVY